MSDKALLFLLGSEVDVCADILDSFPPLPGMKGVDLEMHEAPILLRYHMPVWQSYQAKFTQFVAFLRKLRTVPAPVISEHVLNPV